MSDPLYEVDLQALDQASIKVQELLVKLLADERGVHLEDAIAAIAGVAGAALLRSTGVPLDGMEPGSPVFADAVNELGPRYMGFLSAVCGAMGIDPRSGWTDPIPEANKTLKPLIELTHLVETPFHGLCEVMSIENDLRARLALVTAARLIRVGSGGILDANVGKALALESLVHGSKMVPHPMGDEG